MLSFQRGHRPQSRHPGPIDFLAVDRNHGPHQLLAPRHAAQAATADYPPACRSRGCDVLMTTSATALKWTTPFQPGRKPQSTDRIICDMEPAGRRAWSHDLPWFTCCSQVFEHTFAPILPNSWVIGRRAPFVPAPKVARVRPCGWRTHRLRGSGDAARVAGPVYCGASNS